MIARDRDLLAQLMRLNTALGRFTVAMLDHQHDGHLPADGLRPLGEQLTTLGTDMCTRADELDAITTDE